MRERARGFRQARETLALVPTMGALHEGHLALVREAALHASRVAVSIFVNPTQFGPTEDLARYPRDLEGDLAKLAPLGVDCVFAPGAADVYPPGSQTSVVLDRLPRHLCGLTRTGHFPGVATVVLKLFNMCQPDVAVFGMKDFQQVRVIERMVADLDVPVRIVRYPTVREADGLAMSSRNAYLSEDDRVRAPVIHRTLARLAAEVAGGRRDAAGLAAEGGAVIEAAGGRVEYLAACDPDTLDDVATADGPVLFATAVFFGRTRLIDNELAIP
jgi:pantoate--beta-alanine ligase